MPTWDVFKPNGMQAGFLNPITPGRDPKIEDEMMIDPIQKNIGNCFLIAALGSCAWNTSASMIPVKPSNYASSFTIPFYGYDRTQLLKSTTAFTLKPTTVSNKLYLDDKGMPVYAQPTPSNEIWAAIYEKAFAVFSGCTVDANGNPDVSVLPAILKPADALGVLVNLTRKKFSFGATDLPITAFSTISTPPKSYNGQECADYFDVIQAVCSPSPKGLSGKTRYPMVAWTFDSENYTPNWRSKGLQYRNDTNTCMLIGQHTYSILGLYKPYSDSSSKYIVLRDPLGSTPCGDPFIKDYLAPVPRDASYYWDPVGDATKFTPRDLSKCDGGVFGLRVDAFTGCFSGFGWVQ